MSSSLKIQITKVEDLLTGKSKIIMRISDEYGFVKNAKIYIKKLSKKKKMKSLDFQYKETSSDKYSIFETEEFPVLPIGKYFYEISLILNEVQCYIVFDENSNPVIINEEEFFKEE